MTSQSSHIINFSPAILMPSPVNGGVAKNILTTPYRNSLCFKWLSYHPTVAPYLLNRIELSFRFVSLRQFRPIPNRKG